MGSTYDGLLVVGSRDLVVDALAAEHVIAVVAEAGPDRHAVIPASEQLSGALHTDIGAGLSARGFPVLAYAVYDSDAYVLEVYEAGHSRGSYVFELFRPDGGPRVVDAEMLASFGVGLVDRHRLGRRLDSPGGYLSAEGLHLDVIEALHLWAAPLTNAYAWLEGMKVELPGATWIPAYYAPQP